MSDTLRSIHLLQAALQVKGAAQFEIEGFKQKVTAMGGTKFTEWNKPLDEQGIKLLTCMLAEGGVKYADLVLDQFQKLVVGHYGISSEELQRALKARLEGLN